MGTALEHIITNFYKADMISYLESHPEDFEEVIRLAMTDKQQLIKHCDNNSNYIEIKI